MPTSSPANRNESVRSVPAVVARDRVGFTAAVRHRDRRHANRVLRHREILQAVWGPDSGDDVEALRVVVNQLRKKIEVQPSKPVYLVTVPWVGYRLCLPPDDPPAATKSSSTARIAPGE
jgi:hypothetical protein